MAITVTLLQQSPCSATDSFYRRQASKVDPTITYHQLRHHPSILSKHELSPGLFQIRRNTKNVVVHASVPPQAPFPGDPSPANWKLWIFGTAVAILLSFSKGKWGPLLKLKEKAETTIDELEEIAEVVEQVAEKVDDLAEAAAKNLPEGKLQDAAEFVEKVAERIDKDAQLAGDVLDKVEEIGKQVQSFLDSNTHQEKTLVNEEAKDQK